MSSETAAGQKPSVKNLRAQFEQRAQSSRKIVSPEIFFKEQRDAAEREAQALLLARKKAAAFNMAMRQHELQMALKEHEPTPAQEEQRAKLRREARKLSVALRTMDEVSEDRRPVLQQQERRATNLLLASMAEEFEQEMKKDELDAIREEEEARERAAANAERAKQEEELEKKRKDVEMAHEMAERARKQLEEDEKQRREQEKREEEERRKKQAELEALEKLRAAEIQERDRVVLTTYLHENYPEKLSEVEVLLAKFAGNLDVLFEELGKDQKFKEEDDDDDDGDLADDEADEDYSRKHKSMASTGATTVHTFRDDETVSPGKRNEKSFLKPGVDLRSVITSFYQIYAASKLKDIDDILRHFENRESDLFRTLEVKYDVTFAPDGTCTPNNGDRVGEPFMDAASQQQQPPSSTSKFAVDLQARQLKEKLSKQGQSAETVQAVLSSGSEIM